MNPQVVEYYESLFKFEIMQEPKPLKELVEHMLGMIRHMSNLF